MFNKTFISFLFVLLFSSASYGQLCEDFTKYIKNNTLQVRQGYDVLYDAWEQNQLSQGWNKWRLAMVGNSITNDNVFMSGYQFGIQSSQCEWQTYEAFGDLLCGPGKRTNNCWLTTDKGGSAGNQSGEKATWGCSPGVENAINNLKPMWSVIMFGTNDVSGGSFGLNTSTDQGYRCIIEKLLAVNVIPVLTAISPMNKSAEVDLMVLRVRDTVKAIAEEYNLIWLDLYQAFVDYGSNDGKSLLRDWAHPSKACGNGSYFNLSCLQDGGGNVRSKLTSDVFMMLKEEIIDGSPDTTTPLEILSVVVVDDKTVKNLQKRIKRS